MSAQAAAAAAGAAGKKATPRGRSTSRSRSASPSGRALPPRGRSPAPGDLGSRSGKPVVRSRSRSQSPASSVDATALGPSAAASTPAVAAASPARKGSRFSAQLVASDPIVPLVSADKTATRSILASSRVHPPPPNKPPTPPPSPPPPSPPPSPSGRASPLELADQADATIDGGLPAAAAELPTIVGGPDLVLDEPGAVLGDAGSLEVAPQAAAALEEAPQAAAAVLPDPGEGPDAGHDGPIEVVGGVGLPSLASFQRVMLGHALPDEIVSFWSLLVEHLELVTASAPPAWPGTPRDLPNEELARLLALRRLREVHTSRQSGAASQARILTVETALYDSAHGPPVWTTGSIVYHPEVNPNTGALQGVRKAEGKRRLMMLTIHELQTNPRWAPPPPQHDTLLDWAELGHLFTSFAHVYAFERPPDDWLLRAVDEDAIAFDYEGHGDPVVIVACSLGVAIDRASANWVQPLRLEQETAQITWGEPLHPLQFYRNRVEIQGMLSRLVGSAKLDRALSEVLTQFHVLDGRCRLTKFARYPTGTSMHDVTDWHEVATEGRFSVEHGVEERGYCIMDGIAILFLFRHLQRHPDAPHGLPPPGPPPGPGSGPPRAAAAAAAASAASAAAAAAAAAAACAAAGP